MGTSADGVSSALNDLHISNKENANPQKIIERDGRYFLELLQKEIQHLDRLCEEARRDIQEATAPEEARGKMRTAIGKSQLLITKKFKQFEGLCQDNMEPAVGKKKPTSTDLEGFWDMMSIQISDVKNMFVQIDKLRKSSWTDSNPDEKSSEDGMLKVTSTPPKRSPRNSPRSPRRGKKLASGGTSNGGTPEEEEARKAARSRLQEHMKAARSRNAANGHDQQTVEIDIKCSPKASTN